MKMDKTTTSHQRESQVSESAAQSCQLARDEPDQDEMLEGGIFTLVQGEGSYIQAEGPCVEKQAVPVVRQ